MRTARTLTLTAAVAVAAPLAVLTGPVAAAEAATGTEVRHYAPDTGYAKDLLVRCGTQGFFIIEGRSSADFANVRFGPDCHGVTSVYVRPGEEWWRDGGRDKSWDVTGWHNLPAGWSDGRGIVVYKD